MLLSENPRRSLHVSFVYVFPSVSKPALMRPWFSDPRSLSVVVVCTREGPIAPSVVEVMALTPWHSCSPDDVAEHCGRVERRVREETDGSV